MSEKEQTIADLDPENIPLEELVDSNNIVINTLIDILIEKEVITEQELKDKLASLEEEDIKEE